MDALARLAHGAVAEADDREVRQAGAEVDLDGDLPRVEPRDGEGGDVGEHAATLGRGCDGETAHLHELRVCAGPALLPSLRRTPRRKTGAQALLVRRHTASA